MKTRLVLLALSLALTLLPVQALQIEGVNLPAQKTVNGQVLQLNGAGLRTFKLLVVPIKVYVASLYAPSPLRTADAVFASPGPLQMNFTFLQNVSASDVAKAWRSQFDASAAGNYPGFASDRDTFIGFFGALSSGDTQTVLFSGGTTTVSVNGQTKGTIAGTNFQQAFLSMWFGSNPVTPELKAALLGN
ncbi:MAG: chalcone isomerase family protein [Terrimicrobiaceae bacterium]|nr:chalcone isomerase family protein [Terrimicrobiaceae bacterium]